MYTLFAGKPSILDCWVLNFRFFFKKMLPSCQLPDTITILRADIKFLVLFLRIQTDKAKWSVRNSCYTVAVALTVF